MRIAVVAFAGLLACACGQSGDLSAMLGAFGEAQRSLTAEYLVSVVTVAEEVLPGFQVDVTVNSTAPSVSTNSYCPAPPKEFELFVIEEFAGWNQMLHNMVQGLSTSSAALGDYIVDDRMVAAFLAPRKQLTPFPDATGGSGFGIGMTIFCGANMLFSFGGGGGGGITPNSSGYGGGGGAEISGNMSINGGGGCSCGESLTSCLECSGDAQDDDSVSNIFQMTPSIVAGLNSCSYSDITVCFSGGAGGGVKSPAEQCTFSAGFSVSMAVTISGGSIKPSLLGSSQGDPTLCQGNPNATGGSVVGGAAQQCSHQCISSPDFNDCYCPCMRFYCGD